MADDVPEREPAEPDERAETGLGWPTGSHRTVGRPAGSQIPVGPPPDVPSADEPPAGEPAGDDGAQPGPSTGGTVRRRRFSVAGSVIGLLCALFGFAFVVQLKSNTGDTKLETARPEDLVRILSDLNAREERLRVEIANLQAAQNQLKSGAAGREAALAEARRRADELGILAGTLPAVGEGLVIRLVPATGKRIRAATVLDTIEELRGAGAEAMQIVGGNGVAVRIVASTYFVDGADALVVDGRRLDGPYTVSVIGPAQTMDTALTIPGGVRDTVERDGGNVIVDEVDVVHVDELHQSGSLRWAKPVS